MRRRCLRSLAAAAAAATGSACPGAATGPLNLEGPQRRWRSAEAPPVGPGLGAQPSESERLQCFADLAPRWDNLLGQLDVGGDSAKYRASLLRRARGEVLEVAVGTGQCFECLPANRIVQYVGVDAVKAMLEVAEVKLSGLPYPARLQVADMHALPFDDASFDTVFGTLCLCSCEDPEKALEEMARVCRPGGWVLLLEHGLAASRLLRWVQNFWGMHPRPGHVWEYGCYDDRDPEALVRASPLRVVSVEAQGNIYSIVARRQSTV